MSTLAGGDSEDKDIPDEEKTAFDWCKEGHVTKLESLVTDECINSKDGQVCSYIQNGDRTKICTSLKAVRLKLSGSDRFG